MTSTSLATEQEWLEERRKYATASQVSIILGHNPDCTPHELWAQKVGLIPKPNIGGLLRIRYGKAMEDYVADAYEKLTGRMLINHGPFTIWKNPRYPFLSCTLDREIREPRGCLEIKTTEHTRPALPLHQVIQVQIQLLVCGFDCGEVATFIRGASWAAAPELFSALWNIRQDGMNPMTQADADAAIRKAADGRLEIEEIERDDQFLAAAVPLVEQFMDYVKTKQEPPCGWPQER